MVGINRLKQRGWLFRFRLKSWRDLHHGIRNNVRGLGENALLWKRNSLIRRYMSTGSEFVGTHRLIPSPSIKSWIKANNINNQNTFVNQINANANYNLCLGGGEEREATLPFGPICIRIASGTVFVNCTPRRVASAQFFSGRRRQEMVWERSAVLFCRISLA